MYSHVYERLWGALPLVNLLWAKISHKYYISMEFAMVSFRNAHATKDLCSKFDLLKNNADNMKQFVTYVTSNV